MNAQLLTRQRPKVIDESGSGPSLGESRSGSLIVFAGGGTGGHLYPAIAVAHVLRRLVPDLRFMFFGTNRAIDRHILSQVDAEFVPQCLPTLSRLPWKWPQLLIGLRDAGRIVRSRFQTDRPVAVIGTGGMASVPAVREAHAMGIPTWLLNPDALPGRANRYLSRFADAVFVQWEETKRELKAARSVQVTGCPIREAFATANREAGLQRFGLDPDRRTLLITGASQGAKTINDAILANLDFLKSLADWQILHLAGQELFEPVRDAYAGRGIQAAVLPFTDHMPDALAAADLVISRAGASTLAELTALGKPSVLMPYPFHKDQHQVANAQCLVANGAAQLVLDAKNAEENGPRLQKALEALTLSAKARDTMGVAAKRMGRGNAASTIATEIIARVAPRAV